MVAAMPLQNDASPSEKTVTLRDIRRVAFGLTAAIMIVMIAGAINDGSGSASATTLEEKSETRFAIGITTVAGDNVVTNSEASAGFTVSGTTDQLNTLVTCAYGGVSATDTSDASTGAFSCAYDDSGSNGNTDMSAVNDGTITVTATVGGVSSTVFVTQDTLLPTLTIDMASDGASVGGTNYATIGETITLTITVSEIPMVTVERPIPQQIQEESRLTIPYRLQQRLPPLPLQTTMHRLMSWLPLAKTVPSQWAVLAEHPRVPA